MDVTTLSLLKNTMKNPYIGGIYPVMYKGNFILKLFFFSKVIIFKFHMTIALKIVNLFTPALLNLLDRSKWFKLKVMKEFSTVDIKLTLLSKIRLISFHCIMKNLKLVPNISV